MGAKAALVKSDPKVGEIIPHENKMNGSLKFIAGGVGGLDFVKRS